MRKIIIAALAGLMPLLAAAQQPKKFTIDGKIIADTMATGKIYLQYQDNDQGMRDSSAITNNTYHFEGRMRDGAITANLFWYKTENGIQARKTPFKGFAQFYAVPGTISLVHSGGFDKVTISGSPMQDDANAINKQIRERKRPEIDIHTDYIKTHPDSWLSYLFLERIVKNKQVDLDAADQLYAGLSPGLKKYGQVSAISTLITSGRTVQVGKQALEFTEKDVNGKPVALSSFRGKYVLVDFWASWCHPCRAENPVVAKAYQKYKTKGFEVLGVSLDATKDAWVKAMKQDHVEWMQVSNLSGFRDEIVLKYGITSIPRNFLVNPEGKIVAMDLRGPELEEKLAGILK